MLPGRLASDHPVDLRLWLAGAVDLGDVFWLAVELERLESAEGSNLRLIDFFMTQR